MTQKFLPLIRKNSGRIVQISSVAGLISSAGGNPYSATKYAMESLNDALRLELHPWKVSVSAVNPAFVRTEILTKIGVMKTNAKKVTDPEHVKLYEHVLGEKATKKAEEMMAKADDAQVTTDAITHAICDPHPEIRYLVANVDGTPAWVFAWMKWVLPERLFDAIVLAVQDA